VIVVIVGERLPPSIRGEMNRWLLEPRAGVFVGRLSANVRDRLWDELVRAASSDDDEPSLVLIHSEANEQGFDIRVFGEPMRELVDFDGLKLVRLAPIARIGT
jgi:CRISPR-associated protein Cas2